MSTPDRYTVGWICAITTEYTAARQFLDKEHDLPTHVSANDINGYTLGEMAGHNVVIAVLPRGEYGLSSAATVATNMLNSFPNIRIGLMVGVGGGAPTAERDIRLGDVVVSSPENHTGGVYQYDYGKTIQGRDFHQTGFLNKPPTVVLTALSVLESTYESEGHILKDRINAILEKKPKLRKKYSRPNQETDCLYKSDVVHPYDSLEDCAVVCGRHGIVRRREREEDEDDPCIHYGTIASANQLMKDATTRDTLAKEKGILCFDMEAAGLMNGFPCLVVRGICDYSDSHKNKEWQGYAAFTAAAYARDLLAKMVPSRVEQEGKIKEALNTISQEVVSLNFTTDKVLENLGVLQTQEKMNRVVKWLSASDPSTNHNKALGQHHDGTGLWFTTWSVFEEWKNQSSSFLWMHGISGCGKTVLSSTIVEHLKQDATCQPLLYFYFDFNDEQKQSLDNLLRSLVGQIYHSQPPCREILEQSWAFHGEGSRQPSTRSLERVLEVMLSGLGSVSIVLDALDESKPRGEMLTWLKIFIESTQIICRLLVTSRREEDIESVLECCTREIMEVAIQQDEVNKDISAYVREKVRNGDDLKRWRSRPDLQDEIETRLMEKADGMFRWAACQLEALKDCYNQQKLRNALENLPRTLGETYARILENVPKANMDDATTILRLLAWSRRPLQLEELVDAIAVQPDEKPSFDPDNRMPEPRDVLRICSSLVVTIRRPFTHYLNGVVYTDSDEDDDDAVKGDENMVTELRLAHLSVKEYLMSDRFAPSLSGSLANHTAGASIATICLAYLSSLDHSMPLDELRAQFEFSRYCARYWTVHARVVDGEDEKLQARIVQFLHDRKNAFLTCYNLHDPDQPWITDNRKRETDKPGALYYASLTGLAACVGPLLDKGADINAQGGYYGNALQVASAEGHDKVVKMLLDRNVDVNAKGGDFGHALQASSAKGHVKITEMLVNGGADIDAIGGHYGNALRAASVEGHETIVQLLLHEGANVNALGKWSEDALQAASGKGHESIVRILLDRGADVNADRGYYGSALQAASGKGHESIVRLLLERGADVNADRGYYGSALQAASLGNHDKIVQLLLERGADINAQGGRFGSALEVALQEGYKKVVQILLASGASIVEPQVQRKTRKVRFSDES